MNKNSTFTFFCVTAVYSKNMILLLLCCADSLLPKSGAKDVNSLNGDSKTGKKILQPTQTNATPKKTIAYKYLVPCIAIIFIIIIIIIILFFCFTLFSREDKDLKYTREILGDDAFEFSHIEAP